MASTKTAKTYIASVSNPATNGQTGTVLDHTTAYGGLVTCKASNGATGPTTGVTFNVYTSHTNAAFAPKLLGSVQAGTTNSAVYEFPFVLPPGAMYSRVDVTGNLGQAVTVEAFCQELTTI